MKTIITVLFVIIWVTGMIFIESYYPCGSFIMCIIGISIIFVINLFHDSLEDHDEYPMIMIFFMTCSFIMPIITLCFGGLRIIHEEDSSVRLVSGFYPLGRTLAVGEKVDTLQEMPRYYKKLDNGKIIVHSEDLFLLKKNDTVSILFDRLSLILEGKKIAFYYKDYRHGSIVFISYITPDGKPKLVDSEGKEVNDSLYADPGYVNY